MSCVFLYSPLFPGSLYACAAVFSASVDFITSSDPSLSHNPRCSQESEGSALFFLIFLSLYVIRRLPFISGDAQVALSRIRNRSPFKVFFFDSHGGRSRGRSFRFLAPSSFFRLLIMVPHATTKDSSSSSRGRPGFFPSLYRHLSSLSFLDVPKRTAPLLTFSPRSSVEEASFFLLLPRVSLGDLAGPDRFIPFFSRDAELGPPRRNCKTLVFLDIISPFPPG